MLGEVRSLSLNISRRVPVGSIVPGPRTTVRKSFHELLRCCTDGRWNIHKHCDRVLKATHSIFCLATGNCCEAFQLFLRIWAGLTFKCSLAFSTFAFTAHLRRWSSRNVGRSAIYITSLVLSYNSFISSAFLLWLR